MELVADVLVCVTVAAFFAIPLALCCWAGKCKKCESWNNWHLEDRVYRSEAHPQLRFAEQFTGCKSCGHKQHIGTRKGPRFWPG